MTEETIASDALFALRAKICQARTMSPLMKFQAGSDLFEEACQWSLAGIAARFPATTEAERRQKLRDLLKLTDRRSL